ncbi:hypothetical protein RHMOL_Rhmol05G0189200 [Rhododendron molle]|uniref:Uncharacterized protein n=1 Tax=Rhododendron molle TaxID=49168 RepID=A0ACC0NRQ9_RHOML|nr:hypothetical protein RHMOL_Rhmol05G0189200 [Rhododendron molle]
MLRTPWNRPEGHWTWTAVNAVVTPVAVETLLLKRKPMVLTEEVVEATDGLDLDTKGGGDFCRESVNRNRIDDIACSHQNVQDPFLVISKTVESGTPIHICKTEVLQNDLNSTWKPIYLNVQQMGSKYFLLSYNFVVDRLEEMKKVLGNTAASVGLELSDAYLP